MLTSYKNKQRHESLEMVVSRGQVDFNASYTFDNTNYYGYNLIGGNDTLYPVVSSAFVPNSNFSTPDHHILPRGAMFENTAGVEDDVKMEWANSGTDIVNTSFFGHGNFLAAPGKDGVVYDSSPSNNLTVLDEYTQFIDPVRPTYHSKIFPIFAQGRDTGDALNKIELFNIELPYIKAEVLTGEVTNCVNSDILSTFGASSSQVRGAMRSNAYFNYPVYNAIEVLFCTKSLQPSGNFYKGGAWYKKVFLINYDLYQVTEIPFPGVDTAEVVRHYWRPTGILPSEGSLGFINSTCEKFNNYNSDNTATSTNAFFNVSSDYIVNNSIFTDGIVTQDDTNKKATLKTELKLNTNFVDDPELMSLKGIVKLI